MQSEIRFWNVKDGKLSQLPRAKFGTLHKEADLEEWIEHDPSLVGTQVKIIGRQVVLPEVGEVDLLAQYGSEQEEKAGQLVILEFKRQQTTRETVAQILDYASYLNGIGADALRELTNVEKEKVQDPIQGEPELILVAADLDPAAERITSYLAGKGIGISTVSFSYAVLDDGREVLARTVNTPISERPKTSASGHISGPDLHAIAADRDVSSKVQILRSVTKPKLDWYEESGWANGGTLRYWIALPETQGKVIFGMNVGGAKFDSPRGSLDVWIWPEVAAAYAKCSTDEISSALGIFNIIRRTKRLDLRLETDSQAESLLALLTSWDSQSEEYRLKREADAAASGVAGPSSLT
jgi:hypothetical protein